jgi:hypothetical protein
MPSDKTNNLSTSMELLKEGEVNAYASISQNPFVRWAKFILTDDRPNGNNERVPLSEFDNLIKTGINMPIKMAEGRIEETHQEAMPLGVITHLKKVFEGGINRIEGLAALWLQERPGDVSYLKTLLDSGKPVDLSWEMGASDKVMAEDGVWDWIGVALKATTVVGNPAYLGRTPIIAIANKNKKTPPEKWSDDYIKSLPDSSFLYIERGGDKDSQGRTSQNNRHFPVKDDKGLYDASKLREVLTEAGKVDLPISVLKSLKQTVATLLAKIDAGANLEDVSKEFADAPLENIVLEEKAVELEELKTKVAELTTELETAKASIADKDKLIKELTDAKAGLEGLTTELDELRTFKSDLDKKAAVEARASSIKNKFTEAGLVKDEAYFNDNMEKLLGLEDTALDFMIQELVSFAKTAEASLNGNRVPLLNGNEVEVSVQDIVKALRERKSK